MKRSSKKTNMIENFISFTIVIVIGCLLVGIFTAQQKQRQTFDEQTVQKASKKKTSVEKRVENERSSVESINDSLDAQQDLQNTEDNTAETSQADTTQYDEP